MKTCLLHEVNVTHVSIQQNMDLNPKIVITFPPLWSGDPHPPQLIESEMSIAVPARRPEPSGSAASTDGTTRRRSGVSARILAV